MVYGYCRVSSGKQLDGLSMQLQDDRKLLDRIAKDFNTTASPSVYSDEGHSAFTGKNLENELGTLINDIEKNIIVAGDIIVMRHLDRLSRLSLTGAMSIYTQILKHKVKIYTTINNYLYESGTNSEPMGYLLATLAFATANEESVKKSYLTNKHAVERIRQFENGERTSCGHSYDLGVGSTPFYIKVNNRAVQKHEKNFTIAKELVAYALKGNGLFKCVNWLKLKHGISYSTAGMSNLLRSEALFGRLTVNIQDIDAIAALKAINKDEYITTKHILNGFYPAVCSESKYYQLQGSIKSRGSSDGNRKQYTLLAGGQFLKCGCGCSMRANHTSGKGPVYYTCCGSSCLFSIKIYVLDRIVVSALGIYFMNENIVIDDTKIKGLINNLTVKNDELNSKRIFLVKNRDVFTEEFSKPELQKVMDEIKNLEVQIQSEKTKISSSNINPIDIKILGDWNERVEEILRSSSDEKQEYRNLISKVVSTIQVHPDGLIEVKLINDSVKYFYIPEQMKSTGRRLGVKLFVFDDETDKLYLGLKLDKDFKKIAFTKDEIKNKKYQCKIDEINESALTLYSEEHTRYTAQERFIAKLLDVEYVLGYYILNKKFAMSFGVGSKYFISEKQWQSYKSKCKPIFTKKNILYCLSYVTTKGNITKDFIICTGDLKVAYSGLKRVSWINKIIGCDLIK